MTGVDVAIRSFEREAEEEERYLVANRDRTCGECGNWNRCPDTCCNWGWCTQVDDEGGFVHRYELAVRDYECPHFEERKDNE